MYTHIERLARDRAAGRVRRAAPRGPSAMAPYVISYYGIVECAMLYYVVLYYSILK